MNIERHNTHKVKFNISIFSNLLQVKSPFKYKRTTKAKRGKISGFSRGSRFRLLKVLFSLTVLPTHFLTLTYPKNFSVDARRWKRDLDVFSKALLRAFPKAWFVWKLEPQKRGAPHFHLLGTFGTKVNFWYLCWWLSFTWYRIVGSGDIKHLLAGTQVKVPEGKTAIRKYVSKYVGKPFSENDLPEAWRYPGRYWGIIGRQNFPKRELIYFSEFTVEEVIELKRFIRRWLRSIGRKSKSTKRFIKFLRNSFSFTVFVPCNAVLRFLLTLRTADFSLYFPELPDYLFCFV